MGRHKKIFKRSERSRLIKHLIFSMYGKGGFDCKTIEGMAKAGGFIVKSNNISSVACKLYEKGLLRRLPNNSLRKATYEVVAVPEKKEAQIPQPAAPKNPPVVDAELHIPAVRRSDKLDAVHCNQCGENIAILCVTRDGTNSTITCLVCKEKIGILWGAE